MDKRYRKVEFTWGSTIETAVLELLEYKKEGKYRYGTFNTHDLFSHTVTMDSAYMKIIGKTKEEFDDDMRKQQLEYKREKLEHEENIPNLTEEWIAKGKEILTEDKLEYWNQIVPIRLSDMYRGMELGCCLDIVKILNNGGTMEEAKSEIESQDHSGTSYGLVRSMVREFCERGLEFAEFCK